MVESEGGLCGIGIGTGLLRDADRVTTLCFVGLNAPDIRMPI